jgi:hypothetical protein
LFAAGSTCQPPRSCRCRTRQSSNFPFSFNVRVWIRRSLQTCPRLSRIRQPFSISLRTLHRPLSTLR